MTICKIWQPYLGSRQWNKAMFALYRIDNRSAPKKYRIGLLSTFDYDGPAQFLWRLRTGTLRIWKWYVPYRIASWNAPLLMWTDCSADQPVITLFNSRLGCFWNEYYRSGTMWTAQLQTVPVRLDSTSIVHTVSDRFPNWTENRSGIVWTQPNHIFFQRQLGVLKWQCI